MRSQIAIIALAINLLFSKICVAQSDVLSSEPSAFATATAGYTVYQSQLVESNEPVMTYNYRAGVFGGESRRLGVVVDIENGSYSFPLNGSKINCSTVDVGFRYVWAPFFGTIMLNQQEIYASAPPDGDQNGHLDAGAPAQDFMKISSRGLGVAMGVNYDVTRALTVFSEASMMDTMSVSETYLDNPPTPGLSEKKSVRLGRRTKFNIGGVVQVTKKTLDFTFGYQKHQIPITASGEDYIENKDTIYAGMRFRANL